MLTSELPIDGKTKIDIPSSFPRGIGNKNQIINIHKVIEIGGMSSIRAKDHISLKGMPKFRIPE